MSSGTRSKASASPAPAPADAATAAPPPLVRRATLALLALVVFATFAGSLGNGSVLLDDPSYVFQNPHVSRGVTADGVAWSLGHPHGGNWHPLTSLSHMLDVSLFGLRPAPMHAVNLGLHVLDIALLVLLLYALTGAWWRSLLAGALFGLHPLRVESVAWIAERKDVLSALFFLLTLHAWRRWAARPNAGRYLLAALALALGLAAKPMLVTTPFVLVLLDAWPLGRLRGAGALAPGVRAPQRSLPGLVGEKLPLIALAAGSALATWWVQRVAGAMASWPLGPRAGNAALSVWRYVAQTLWPAGLSPHYPFPRAVPLVPALAAALAIALATALALRAWRTRPALAVGWLWYFGMLVPVIGLVQVGMQAHADRYTYLPGIGLLIALLWGVSWPTGRVVRAGLAVAGVAVAALLGVATARQVTVWHDTRALFTRALRVTGGDVVIELGLGNALEADSLHAEALDHLRRAVALDPGYLEARRALGVALQRAGRPAEAEAEFRAILAASPGSSAALFGLGVVAQEQGRLPEAADLLRRALARPDENESQALLRLGAVVSRLGHGEEGLALIRRSLDLAPGDWRGRLLLAAALIERGGRDREAAGELERALRDSKGDADVQNALAWLRATSADAAVRDADEALRLSAAAVAARGDPDRLDTQAAAEARGGRFDLARATARRALDAARAAGADLLARGIAVRLGAYERGEPWTEPAR